MSTHNTNDHHAADDLSARVLHARAEGAVGRLPGPTRTLAVGPADMVRTARIDDGDEVCIANRSGGPIGVLAEPDPALLGDWAENLIAERDALAARVAELERERDALMALLVVPHGDEWAAHHVASDADEDGLPALRSKLDVCRTEAEAVAWIRAAAGLGDAKGEVRPAPSPLRGGAAGARAEACRLRDRLARLVDSGDLDGARAMARGILEGEGEDAPR